MVRKPKPVVKIGTGDNGGMAAPRGKARRVMKAKKYKKRAKKK